MAKQVAKISRTGGDLELEIRFGDANLGVCRIFRWRADQKPEEIKPGALGPPAEWEGSKISYEAIVQSPLVGAEQPYAMFLEIRQDGETVVLATGLSIEAATRAMDLIAGVSVSRFASGRYLMNTDADEGFTDCASGSLFGSTICTRAITTPSIFDNVSSSSCDRPITCRVRWPTSGWKTRTYPLRSRDRAMRPT